MCGIGGILRLWPVDQRELALATPHHRSIPEAWLDILDDSIRHRGPDGQGRFRDRAIRADGSVVDVAFVHRRLSIIDHAGGAQPMVSSSPSPREGPGVGSFGAPRSIDLPPPLIFHGQPNDPVTYRPIPNASPDLVAVAFNGCIYNHRELRAELQRAGHVFTTDHSDTEVLVHGWREWHEELFQRFDGMYSVAIWDRCDAAMALRRDIFGEKPLHSTLCATTNGSIEAFASTASALHRLRGSFGEIRSVREQECTDWLIYGFSDAIAGVDEVWPGGRDDLSDGVAPEHEFGVRRALEGGRQNRLTADQAETLLRQAVSNRLEADVPIGCFLSGGVDSSLIATFASQARPSLETLCVRMPDPRFDESEFAIRVAKVIGSRHQTVDCQANLATDIASLMVQGGVPFGDSSLLPTLWACRAAGRQFRVMLSGDGGDELFGGYERYRAAEVVRRWRWLLSTVPVARLRRSNSRSQSERLARLSDAARAGDAADLLRIFPKALWTGLFSAHSLREIPQLLGHLSAESLIRRDLLLYLPFDLMRKSDSASMSVPLEARAPFLAKGLSSAAMNAPLSSLMPRGQRKGLLRQVARKYLPAEIVDRPKMGFAIPIGEWFRTDYGGLRTMLLDHLNSTEPFGPPSLGIDLNMTFIRQMLDEHLGTGPSGLVKRDHSQRLYMLLVLSIWAKWMGSLKA